jgi:hypothetical protein
MANSQDIEARLCAYIDGELTPAQRADIEHHLADHPQHRQMIQDLMRTRTLVAALPRLKAPADLGEGLQGQLERSMLLGRHDEPADPWRLGSGRVHKLAVTAALMLLMIGLGSVIFVLLRAAAHPAKLETMVATPAPAPPSLPPPPLQPQPPPRLAAVPQTQPAPVLLAALPATQPDAVAATQPSLTTDLDDFAEGDMMDMDDDAPATQPVAMQPTPTQPAATQAADPATQPAARSTTMPVADDADDK